MSPQVNSLQIQAMADMIDQCMLVDRPRLRNRLHRLSHSGRAGVTVEQEVQRLAGEIERSQARVRDRLEHFPKPAFPADLPVVQRRQEIAQAIEQNQVVVLTGETGSGKTTQLPNRGILPRPNRRLKCHAPQPVPLPANG